MKSLRFLLFSTLLGSVSFTHAATPVWTFEPLTATNVTVSPTTTANVQYRITNQSSKIHTLVLQPMDGVMQIASGAGTCASPFVLTGKSSCVLTLQINGSQVTQPVVNGPTVCQQGGTNQCYRPAAANVLHITQNPTPPPAGIPISLANLPLTMLVNGVQGSIIVNNLSTNTVANEINADFAGTALAGKVTQVASDCHNVPATGSCTLTFQAGGSVVPLTDFIIKGTNTSPATAQIGIATLPTVTATNPNSGSTFGAFNVTVSGTGFLGATDVTFGGTSGSNVVVVNSTTLTVIAPANAPGPVNVVVTTPGGSGTLTNGFTYNTAAVGQPTGGGVVGCTNGGFLTFIVSTVDNSNGIEWGATGTTTATDPNNGFTNTSTITTALGNNGGVPYAAQLCSNYQIDSEGHSPCQTGACYTNWYLPAVNQMICVQQNQVAIGGTFASNFYWSSTERDASSAYDVSIFTGSQSPTLKTKSDDGVRCIRSIP